MMYFFFPSHLEDYEIPKWRFYKFKGQITLDMILCPSHFPFLNNSNSEQCPIPNSSYSKYDDNRPYYYFSNFQITSRPFLLWGMSWPGHFKQQVFIIKLSFIMKLCQCILSVTLPEVFHGSQEVQTLPHAVHFFN